MGALPLKLLTWISARHQIKSYGVRVKGQSKPTSIVANSLLTIGVGYTQGGHDIRGILGKFLSDIR